MLKNEYQFLAIHNQVAPQPTNSQSQVASDVALSQLTDQDYEKLQEVTPSNPTGNKKDKKKKLKRCLFLHTTYETRLRSLKRDIHKAYKQTFTDKTVNCVKLIVGNTNNPKAKSEFIRRKRPHIKFRRPDYQSSM